MSDPVIQVENLGKKYIIGHQQEERYTALRDVMANGAKSFGRKLLKPFGKRMPSPDFEEFWALKDVSFEIKQGDRVGIIGRNGAGKSTLLKILSRITEPTTGRISIDGRVASLLEVGTGFHPELTGRENIYLNGAILGMSKAELKRKFDEIVAFAEVEKFLDTPVKRYSSGMYVRLAFAVAAHLESEILIVDEVLAVGDTQFQKKCLGKMEEVGKAGRTVLFVSHNMATINFLCQKGILLEKGVMLMQGSSQACIEAYSETVNNRFGSLLEHQKIRDSNLKVIDAKINGTDRDILQIPSNERIINIELIILAGAKCRVSLHAFLKDRYGQNLGIYSPGHMEDEIYYVKPGTHKLSGQIILPKLTKGEYFLDIGISDPGVLIYIDFPLGIKLEFDGIPTKTGLVFEQNNYNGFQILGGSVKLETVANEE